MSPEELLASPRGRRLISASSPAFFDSYYCGMRRADHRDAWLELLDGGATQAKQSGIKHKLLILAPRDHGTTDVMITYAVRALCINRDIRI